MDTTTSLHTLDLALRAGLIGLLLFAAALLLRDRARSNVARAAAAFAVGTAAYALYAMPGFASPPQPWQLPILALSAGNSVMFWLFSRALFDDDFRFRSWHAAAWGGFVAAALLNCFVLGPAHSPWARPLGVALDLTTLSFAVLAVGQSLSSWRDDLVEGRRRLRLFIVGAGAVYTLLLTLGRLVVPRGVGGSLDSSWASVLDALALTLIAVVVLWHLLRVSRWGVLAPESSSRDLPAALPLADTAPPPAPDAAALAADERLAAALDTQMTVERAYREEALTIGALASKLGVPEYRLRRLINQRLGYRNFNAFLNRHRIDEARQALADPAQAEVPVLTIAMDVGFQSIGPFNRAFKADTGLTPTEFRRLGGRVPPARMAESSLQLADSEIGQ